MMVLESGEVLGFGSNKFGQLGLAELITFEKPERILKGINVKSVHCGAEHTFIITGTATLTQKSMKFSAWG